MIASRLYTVVVAVLLGLFLSPVVAQSPLSWERLNRSEQQVLEQYAPHWSELDPAQQHTLQRIARDWQQMSPEQRAAMQQRLQRWSTMSGQEKRQFRENYRRLQQLAPEQRQQLEHRREVFKKLTDEQRRELMRQWRRKQSAPPEKLPDSSPMMDNAAGSREADDSGKSEGAINDPAADEAPGDSQSRPEAQQPARPLNMDRMRPDRNVRPSRPMRHSR